MPFKSKAQRSAMYAAAAGDSNVGIPEDAAQSFIAHSEKGSGSLPERAPKKKKRRLKAKRKKR